MARGERGFTLVEVSVVMAVVGLLIWVALPRSFASDIRRDAAARQIQSDIRYTQELAMTRGTLHQIRFYSATNPSPTNRYEVVTAASQPVVNPLTRAGSYVVDFNSGPFAGAQLDSTVTIEFNSLGRPTGGSTISISLGGGSRTLTVSPETGLVTW